jgi:hypothetical protein
LFVNNSVENKYFDILCKHRCRKYTFYISINILKWTSYWQEEKVDRERRWDETNKP